MWDSNQEQDLVLPKAHSFTPPSSGDKSQMTLLSALSSLGELTQQLNMESGQFSVEMVEQEGNEESTKLPSFAC